MAWLGIGMVLVGGVLVYSGYKNLSPWKEFLAVLSTGKTVQGTPVASNPLAANPNVSAGQLAQKGKGQVA